MIVFYKSKFPIKLVGDILKSKSPRLLNFNPIYLHILGLILNLVNLKRIQGKAYLIVSPEILGSKLVQLIENYFFYKNKKKHYE